MDRAVNRVVKWFILILVIVFDPLAVTLVIAYNASLLRKKRMIRIRRIDARSDWGRFPTSFFRVANLPLILFLGAITAWGAFRFFDSGSAESNVGKTSKSALLGDLSARRFDDRSFAYVPERAFGTCSFSGVRMMEQVGVPKILSNYLTDRIPF